MSMYTSHKHFSSCLPYMARNMHFCASIGVIYKCSNNISCVTEVYLQCSDQDQNTCEEKTTITAEAWLKHALSFLECLQSCFCLSNVCGLKSILLRPTSTRKNWKGRDRLPRGTDWKLIQLDYTVPKSRSYDPTRDLRMQRTLWKHTNRRCNPREHRMAHNSCEWLLQMLFCSEVLNIRHRQEWSLYLLEVKNVLNVFSY